MTLRNKAAALIFGTMVALCLALAAILGTITIRSYSRLENEETRMEVKRVKNSLQLSLARLASTTADWASWDESYAFIQGRNPGFIGDNLSPAALSNLELSLVAFLDPAGKSIWLGAFDLPLRLIVPVPKDFEVLPAGDILLQHADARSGAAGIMRISGNRLLLVASRPVTTSDYSAPIAGSLVMGRLLDETEVDVLAEQTSLNVTIARADDPGLAPDFAKALALLPTPDSIYVSPLGGDTMAGYSLLADIHSGPAAIIRVLRPRDIQRQSLTGIGYIVLSLAFTALVSTFLVALIIDRLVLRRLAILGADVTRIGNARDLQARVGAPGRDELSTLAATINTTLSKLEAADHGLRASLAEKEILLREIHHRVKNNLQVVSSLLSLQSGMTQSGDARDALKESQGRIHSMALIHEFLYRGSGAGIPNLAKIDFRGYLSHLSKYLMDVYAVDWSRIGVETSGVEISLDADTAITCGLIANELVSNSLKHAFPEGRGGKVSIGVHEVEAGRISLSVGDDGVGFPPGFDPEEASSMGWQLVTTLAKQLAGKLEISGFQGSGQGAQVRLTFTAPSAIRV